PLRQPHSLESQGLDLLLQNCENRAPPQQRLQPSATARDPPSTSTDIHSALERAGRFAPPQAQPAAPDTRRSWPPPNAARETAPQHPPHGESEWTGAMCGSVHAQGSLSEFALEGESSHPALAREHLHRFAPIPAAGATHPRAAPALPAPHLESFSSPA